MAWKKIIVSGSTADLANVNVDGAVVAQTLTGSADFNTLANKPTLVSGSTQIVESLVSQSVDLGDGGISASYFSGDGSGLTNLDISQVATVAATFTNEVSLQVSHNFDSRNVNVAVYDENNYLILPASVQLDSLDTVTVTFDAQTSGTVVVSKGGHIVSGSIDFSDILNAPTLLSSSATGTSQGQIKINGVDIDVKDLQSTSTPTFAGLNTSKSILPTDPDAYDLGSAAFPFRDLFLSAASLHLGDITLSIESNKLVAKDSSTGQVIEVSGSIDFENIGNTPTLISSSEQIATAISGAFQADSASLASSIDTQAGRIDAILNASTADADSFKEIVDLINSVDLDNDNAFATFYSSSTQDSSSFSSRVSTLESDVAALGDTYATDVELNASSSAILSSVDTISSSLAAGISSNLSDITALQSDSASFSTRVSTNESDIADLQSFSASLDATFASDSELTNVSASLAAGIDSNLLDITDLQLDSASFSTRVSSNEGDISALQSDSASFSGRVSSNESDITALQSDSASFSTRVATNESDISALQSFSSSLDSTFATDAELSAVSSSFEQTIANLSSTITISGSTGVDDINLVQDDLSIVGEGGITTEVANNTVTIKTTGSGFISGSATGDAQGQIKLNGVNTDINGLSNTSSPVFGGLRITGDLIVEGDTIEAQISNLNVEDRFILLNSGSTTGDAGIIFGGSDGTANEGSGIFWDAPANVFGYAQGIASTDTAATHTSKLGNIQVGSVDPSAAPTFQGAGTLHVNDADSSFWIYG